jgi:putative ABC transport system permease protein
LRFAWLEYLSAFRNVTRQYRRSLFGVSAVTFGVVALTLAAGFIEWIFWATREGTIQSGLGHIHAVRPGYLDGGQADPLKYLLPQESPIKDAIGRFPMIRLVAPRLAFTGLISRGDATISFVGEGVSPDQERQLSLVSIISAGRALANDDPKGIVLGRGLADNLGVKVGTKVVLLANNPTGGINAVECTVRGLFNTVSKAYDDSALRVPLPVAQQLLRVSGSHRWVLVLEDTKQTTRTLLALRKNFRDSGVEFIPWYDLADFYNKVVALLSTQITVVYLIIAIIIILSISNTMMMNVLERTAEIGTCLAIGRSQRQILRQFVYEGLTIGLIGGTLGLVLGWLLAIVISSVGIPMPPPPGQSQGYSGEIMFTAQIARNALLLAVGTTLLASAYPAWKASRMGIADALRHGRP